MANALDAAEEGLHVKTLGVGMGESYADHTSRKRREIFWLNRMIVVRRRHCPHRFFFDRPYGHRISSRRPIRPFGTERDFL
ncbi:hypothetical protein D3C80_1677620 [compost metagenome]